MDKVHHVIAKEEGQTNLCYVKASDNTHMYFGNGNIHVLTDEDMNINESYAVCGIDVSEMPSNSSYMEGRLIQSISGKAEITMNNVDFIKSFWKSLIGFRWKKKKRGKYSHNARKHKNSFGGRK